MPDPTLGTDLGDPERFEALLAALTAFLGDDWLSAVHEIPDLSAVKERAGDSQDGENFLRALRAHTSTAADAQTAQDRSDVQLRLLLGAIAVVVGQVADIEGSARVRRELRDRARAWQFEAFFDKLFECEAALHWSRSSGVSSVAFPSGPHPDVWTDIAVADRTLRYPHECKRIQPHDPRGQRLDDFADVVEQRIRALWTTMGALKCTVWLHAPADEIEVEAVLADLADLAALARAAATPVWHTRSDANGTYQLCLALAPEFNDLEPRPVLLPDIPAHPVLRVVTETEYLGSACDPCRLKYVLSVRSDVLPNRIGAFERNLAKALRQIPESQTGLAGIVNVRLRPPRDLGDLYEADAIARRLLSSREGAHVSLVCLCWNELEREEGPVRVDGVLPGRDVREMRHLRAHYVAAPRSPVDFSPLDTGAARFPPADGVLMRDPGTGTIAPVPLAVLALLDAPVTAEPDLSPTDDALAEAGTLYFELEAPYRQDLNQIVRVFALRDRVFMAQLAADWTFRVIEFAQKAPARVATVDLRAWLGQTEFIFWLRDVARGWSLKAGHADGVTTVTVKSVSIPRAFL